MTNQPRTVTARVASVLSPQQWAGLLTAIGILFIFQDTEQYLEIVTGTGINFLTAVGVVYVSISGTLLLLLWFRYGEHSFPLWIRLITVAWGIMLTGIFVNVVGVRLKHEQLTPTFLKLSLEVSVILFLKFLPMSTLFLLGVAKEPISRRKARVAVFGSFGLVVFLTLLQWYQGSGWAIFGLVAVILLTILTITFGAPLYLLGFSTRLQDT